MLTRENLQSEIFNLVNGSLHVIHSPRTGIPIIFLHGAHRLYQNAEIWLRFIPALYSLPLTLRPVLIDLPGHGKSPTSKDSSDHRKSHLPIMVDFIKKMGFNEFFLIGRSYGGWLAMKLASWFPDKTRGLFLIAPAGADKAPRYLSQLKAPVQVLWAEDDPIIPSSDATIFQQISNRIDCYILPATNRGKMAHSPEQIVPEIFLKLLSGLISSVLPANFKLRDASSQ